MPNLVLKPPVPADEPVVLRLEESSNKSITLRAKQGETDHYLLTFEKNGEVRAHESVSKKFGFILDEDGRLVVIPA